MTIIDQIFTNIDGNGRLKTSISDILNCHPLAQSIIEKMLKGYNFETEDLLILLSEVPKSTKESIVRICSIAYDRNNLLEMSEDLSFFNKYLEDGTVIHLSFIKKHNHE